MLFKYFVIDDLTSSLSTIDFRCCRTSALMTTSKGRPNSLFFFNVDNCNDDGHELGDWPLRVSNWK